MIQNIYPYKTTIQKDTCTCMFKATQFPRAKTWKQRKCPSTDEWMKKLWNTQWNITLPQKIM